MIPKLIKCLVPGIPDENRRKEMNKVLKDTRTLVVLGLMLAITIILDLTPLGAIPIGTVSATITHVPTIITGVVLGPIAGFIMGTALGIVSLLHALTRPATPLDPLFINPLISLLPRMFIGVMSYYGYKAVSVVMGKSKLSDTIGAAVGGVLGSLTNTVLVLGMLYIVYVNDIIERLALESAEAVRAMFAFIVVNNAIMEAVVAGVITTAIATAYFQYYRKS